MASTLRNRLSELAKSFSAGVMDAIRGASLEELLSESSGGRPVARGTASSAHSPGPTRRRSGRLPRRSTADISKALDAIVDLLSQKQAGLRAEEIRKKLGLQAKELPRPLKEGLDSGRLTKSGRKRATTYFAGAAPSAGRKAAAAGPARRGRGRPKKKSSPKVTRKVAAKKRAGRPAKKRGRGKAKR